MTINKNSFSSRIRKVFVTALFFLFLSLLHVSFISVSCGFIAIMCDSGRYYGLGYPQPFIVWDIPSNAKFLSEVTVTTTNGEILSQRIPLWEFMTYKEFYTTLSLTQSVFGFIVDSVFWLIIGSLLRIIFVLKSKYLKISIMYLAIIGVIVTTLAGFLSTIDVSRKLAIERGAPFPYLVRLVVSSLTQPYSERFYIKPFIFVLDFLIITSLLILIFVIVNRIKRLFTK